MAVFEESVYLKKQMEQYNQMNTDYEIQIRHYERSEQPQEDGVLLLQREIASGEDPNRIDFGRECCQGQERLLYPSAFKTDIMGNILSGSMDYYIDWETGECYFDGKEFCEILKFCNQFPERLEIDEDFAVKQTFLEDKALLLPISLRSIYNISRVEHVFGGKEVSFIGFPQEGSSGKISILSYTIGKEG